MKHILHIISCAAALLGATLTASAQTISNTGFETWERRGVVESPQGWYTTDDLFLTQGATFDVGTVSKSADAQQGTTAAQLLTQQAGTRRLPGLLLLGGPANTELARKNVARTGGAAYTGRPTGVQFWYKLNLSTNDTLEVAVILSKNAQPIGGFISRVGISVNTSTYTQTTVPINYRSTVIPDTIRVYFLVGVGRGATGASTMSVDNITLQGVTTRTANPELAAALSVYPNPSSSGEFSLASAADPALATAPLTVTDAAGRLVLRQGAASRGLSTGRPVDLRGHGPGLYLLQLDTPQGPVTRKLVIH
ncbi:T9SS type A sorting domain-containing protein [Hymenobacter weizhouensis]|uniref:T9SS type A sorting domain-containing protein n=1 Tax=Hymenobacter sp. YIM 151500-1 TaxID=2987689 RepID=UPI00222648D8|nr:T9SS type A sorting domain-containing protein [Hymenobacter sp. YIM 151500-1]UYZ63704.1 T9SS type A sorting domain-containing protein [Hymenobacter sp. YIM 151500-1]